MARAASESRKMNSAAWLSDGSVVRLDDWAGMRDTASSMSQPVAQPHPLQFDLDRTAGLRIRWSDGVESALSLVELRKACPCATCRAEREERQRNPLVVLKSTPNPLDQVTVASAELMGRYALRIAWKDGHDTGIYDFGLLRRLDPTLARNASRS